MLGEEAHVEYSTWTCVHHLLVHELRLDFMHRLFVHELRRDSVVGKRGKKMRG